MMSYEATCTWAGGELQAMAGADPKSLNMKDLDI